MRVWVAELDERTCDTCMGLSGMAIDDWADWFDEVGAEPGDVHDCCRCFEMNFTSEELGYGPEVEPHPIPEFNPLYEYALPLGALLLLWPRGEEPEELDRPPTQGQEDDYESMLEWTELWG